MPNRTMNMRMFISTYVVVRIFFTFYLIITFFNIFSCRPIEKFWNLFISGSCYDINTLLKTMALFNIISDVVILILPISSIWNLQVSSKQKIGIWIVFGTGVL